MSCVPDRNNIGLNPADPVPAITGHTVGSHEVPVGRFFLNVRKKISLIQPGRCKHCSYVMWVFLVTLNVADTVV